MNVEVDAGRCQGHGRCNTICPGVFDLDDDGYAAVLTPTVPDGETDAVQRAVASCPEGAISVS